MGVYWQLEGSTVRYPSKEAMEREALRMHQITGKAYHMEKVTTQSQGTVHNGNSEVFRRKYLLQSVQAA